MPQLNTNQTNIKLIHEFLQNRPEKLLEEYRNLIDFQLVDFLEQQINILKISNSQAEAEYISSFRNLVLKRLGREETLTEPNFFDRFLSVIKKDYDDTDIIYDFLRENIDNLNDELSVSLQEWANSIISEENGEKTEYLVKLVTRISDLINDFSEGNKENNRAIALTGYTIIDRVLQSSEKSETWAKNKKKVGLIYLEQNKNNKSANTVEKAITYLRASLEFYTEQYPGEFTFINNTLGEVYLESNEGNKTNNLQKAVQYFSTALTALNDENLAEQKQKIIVNLHKTSEQIGQLSHRETKSIQITEKAEQQKESITPVVVEENSPSYNSLTNSIVKIFDGLDLSVEGLAEAIVNFIYSFNRAFFDKNIEENLQVILEEKRKQNRLFSVKSLQYLLRNFPFDDFQKMSQEEWRNLEQGFSQFQGFFMLLGFNKEEYVKTYLYAVLVSLLENLDKLGIIFDNHFMSKFHIFIQLITSYTEDNSVISSIVQKQSDLIQDRGFNLLFKIFIPQLLKQEVSQNQQRMIAYSLQQYSNTLYDSSLKAQNKEKKDNYLRNALEVLLLILPFFTKDEFPDVWVRNHQKMGDIYFELTNHEKALEYYVSIEESFQEIPEYQNFLGDIRYKQAVCYGVLKEFEKQITALSKVSKEDERYLLTSSISEAQEKGEILSASIPSESYKFYNHKLRRQSLQYLIKLYLGEENTRQQNYSKAMENVECLKDIALKEFIIDNQIQSGQFISQQFPHLSFEEIQRLLPDQQTAIIDWYVTEEIIYAFIVTSENEQPKLEKQCLDENSLELLNKIESFYTILKSNTEARTELEQAEKSLAEIDLQFLEQLTKILHLEQIINLLPPSCNQLIIIPHPFLSLLPVHTLPINETSLIQRFERGVIYAPSCQLLKLVQNRQVSELSHLLAVNSKISQYPYLDVFVDSISDNFEHKTILKENVTKESLNTHYSEKLSSANSIIFPCYRSNELSSLEETGLLLANDEILNITEVFNLNLSKSRLVTIFATESHFYNFTTVSDGYITLPSGLLYAGSMAIIGSLWEVPQEVTTLVLIKLYENLKKNPEELTVALKEAQLWLKKKVDKEELEELIEYISLKEEQRTFWEEWLENMSDDLPLFSNPYYWSSFYVMGR